MYLLRRLIHLLPVVLGITVFIFLMLHLIPGDPARIILGMRATQENVAHLRQTLGLDKPLLTQYLIFMGNLVQGNLGNSIVYRQPVVHLILERLPVTLLLTLFGTLFGIGLAIPMGLQAAVHRRGPADGGIRVASSFGLTMPPFWIGIILMFLLGVRLRLFPVSGFGEGLLAHLWHLALPSVVVGIYLGAIITRSVRVSVIEVLRAEFITAARAKGLRERAVVVHHALRNALLPTVSILGINIGFLLGGTVVVEKVFALPGLGELLVNSIFTRDYPIVQGITLMFSLLIILINLGTDLLYGALDPRIRLHR